jgi:hypothetical protein
MLAARYTGSARFADDAIPLACAACVILDRFPQAVVDHGAFPPR